MTHMRNEKQYHHRRTQHTSQIIIIPSLQFTYHKFKIQETKQRPGGGGVIRSAFGAESSSSPSLKSRHWKIQTWRTSPPQRWSLGHCTHKAHNAMSPPRNPTQNQHKTQPLSISHWKKYRLAKSAMTRGRGGHRNCFRSRKQFLTPLKSRKHPLQWFTEDCRIERSCIKHRTQISTSLILTTSPHS
jgi:hypothetical protein